MKRVFCLLLALVMIVSLGSQAFADDVLFCRICGKQIPVDSKVCPYCGEKNKSLDLYCVKCGKRLDLIAEEDGGKR